MILTTGTIHHDYCPECGNRSVDTVTGYCHYAYCGKEEPRNYDDDIKPKRKRIATKHKPIANAVLVASSTHYPDHRYNIQVMSRKKIWAMDQQLPEGSVERPYKSTELVVFA
jgi:hypothetical protein